MAFALGIMRVDLRFRLEMVVIYLFMCYIKVDLVEIEEQIILLDNFVARRSGWSNKGL